MPSRANKIRSKLLCPLPHDPSTSSWVHYERLLEEAVTFYRSGGGGNRIPMGEAFMTTHSFAADRVDGEYAIRMREYEDRYEPRLATCREIVSTGVCRAVHIESSRQRSVVPVVGVPLYLLAVV